MKKVFIFAMMIFATFQVFAELAYIRSAEATSTFSETLSGNKIVYDALNAFDDRRDTVWCEDDYYSGIGEKLTVTFYQPITIDEIRIINGFAHKDYYKKNNRVKKLNIACIDFDDGTEAEYTLKDDCEDFQSIYLENATTVSTVVFTVQEVYKGAKYNDTCIDEIRFYCNGSIIDNRNVEKLKKAKKDAQATASDSEAVSSELYNKLLERANREYQTKGGKTSGIAFLMPLNRNDDKGYAIQWGDFGFYECRFRTVDEYKSSHEERFWQWTENPELNINDYQFIVDIVYRWMDHREFSFDSTTNSILTEEKLYGLSRDSFYGSFEIKDYLVDVDPTDTYEPYSSVSEPNYRIDVNGESYLLLDPECLFVNYWEP